MSTRHHWTNVLRDVNTASLDQRPPRRRHWPGHTSSQMNFSGHVFVTRASHRVGGFGPWSDLERDGLPPGSYAQDTSNND
ncbi:hypothetical protein ACOMHN_065060 [Nucella lapillus]